MQTNNSNLTKAIDKVVIVGGGSAGWMTASALANHLPKNVSVNLVESDQISTVGVGEATIPDIRTFNEGLGIDEAEFMRETNATFKLSIRFENWGKVGDAYNHAFGIYGYPIEGVPFHNYWLKMRNRKSVGDFGEYNLANRLCELNKFAQRQFAPNSPDSRYYYAFQFDASLYAKYLRKFSEARGVKRTEGKVQSIAQDNETGFINSITLESGEQIHGDLFIDCTGFRALLIEQFLKVGYTDWSHWLPVNRAWAVSSTYPNQDSVIPPYTRARALTAGWQWRIPLQNRTGDGNVFCSDYISEQQALDQFIENIEGEPINDPRLIKFTTGKRNRLWDKNCVAIGLSAGFLEPLESTSIYLIQAAILQLIRSFPTKDFNQANSKEFNRLMDYRYEDARNFLILHYHATEREDTEFWKYCKNMSIPGELKRKMELFKECGIVSGEKLDLFSVPSWLAVYTGQGIYPKNFDHRVNRIDESLVVQYLKKMKTDIDNALIKIPSHNQTLANYCKGELIGTKR
jgi:tryptophan 7-halogenase